MKKRFKVRINSSPSVAVKIGGEWIEESSKKVLGSYWSGQDTDGIDIYPLVTYDGIGISLATDKDIELAAKRFELER